MLPSITSPNQELLLAMCQKQMQNNGPQSGSLAQLMQMNVQFNLLKLLAQEAAAGSSIHPDSSHNPIFSALHLRNQNTSLGSQLTKPVDSQLTALLSQNKPSQRSLCEVSTVSPNSDKPQSLPQSETSALLETSGNAWKSSISKPNNPGSKIKTLPSQDFDEKDLEGLCSKSKKIKKMNVCGHTERAHYAKNMCNQCYHKFGRTKKPWKCNHDKLYAHGLCQSCYINAYNKKRNVKKEDDDVGTGQQSVTEEEIEKIISSLNTDEPLTVEDKLAFGDYEGNKEVETSHN